MTTTVLASIPSPAQGVWYLGSLPLRAYALFIIVGIVAALVIGDRRWVARGGEPGVIYDVALWAVPFGLIGGRVYHVITDWSTYFGVGGAGLTAALRIWDGGLGIWGAVAMGGVGAWIACRRQGIPLPAFGDAIAPGIILAQAIGRLGNYFNQELYGRPTTLPWGLEIYERRNADGVLDSLNGVSTGQLVEVVHPTFLYELLWNLLVFAALILIDRKFQIGHGRLFAVYVAGYCLGRFWIELMRSDTATLLAGIRVNSFTATFVFIGAAVYIMAAPKGREDPVTLRGRQHADGADGAGLAQEIAGAAVTTGVVAAAKVAVEEDKDATANAASGARVTEFDGLGSVEGDEVAAAAADAPEAHEVAVEGEAEAAELIADAGDAGEAEEAAEAEASEEVTEADEAEESAEAGAPEEAGNAGDVEESADAGESGDAGEPAETEDEAEALDETEVESGGTDAGGESESGDGVGSDDSVTGVDGLGSVEGDEVAAAAADAPEAHGVAVEGAAEAAEVAAEAEALEEAADAGDVEESAEATEADEAEEPAETKDEAEALNETEVESGGTDAGGESESGDGAGSDDSVTEVEGLGSVDSEELA
ncbi:MAG: prolipoprotein diacylglyceryl transferase, partial [Mycolicibacterium sp.]|uniref:prolipoprotein diacylglyceryl transferase n=1 Tax=Mycolicibacterium sp. TaxID=2320850 RepID=UPI003D1180D4